MLMCHSEFFDWFFREDLPHRLVLPPAVRNAKTSQELTALAMLGQGRLFSVCFLFKTFNIKLYTCISKVVYMSSKSFI